MINMSWVASGAGASRSRAISIRLLAGAPRGAALTITIIDVVRRDRRTTLRVHGEVDLATAPALRERLLEVLQESPEEVVVDLAKVTFLDVVAVGVLDQATAAAGHRHIPLVLTRVPRQVLRILELTASDLIVRDAREGDL